MTTSLPDIDPGRPTARSARGLAIGFIAAALLALAALVYLNFTRSSASSAGLPDQPIVKARLDAPMAQTALDAATLYDPGDIKPLSEPDAMAVNAAIPVAGTVGGAAASFVLDPSRPELRQTALQCLTAALYYEAGSESDDGQRAVAQVILNRMRHPAYPSSVCGVVYQGSTRTTGCQFTFTCDGALARIPSVSGWSRSRKLAEAALSGRVYAPVGHSTHYHADFVVPYWAASLDKTATIGRHIFYRWTGRSGKAVAFTQRYAQAEADPSASRIASLETSPALLDPKDPLSIASGELRIASGSIRAAPIEDRKILEQDRRPTPRLLADSEAGTLRLPLGRRAAATLTPTSTGRAMARNDTDGSSCDPGKRALPVQPARETRNSASGSPSSQSTCL